MSTRYGRRAADGTLEYHDSKETLIAAERRESSESRAGFFGLIGLLLGGVLTYVAILKLGVMDWPKWLRLSCIVLGAGVGAFTLSKLADLIWSVIQFLIGIAVLYGIGSILWNAL